MIDIGYYLLKVMTCSGILFLYYHLALRNKLFHQWNRFYLLTGVLLSLIVPCLHFTIGQPGHATGIQLLQVVNVADEYMVKVSNRHHALSLEQGLYFGYALVSFVILLALLFSVSKIIQLAKRYQIQRINTILFVDTDATGTPFSFFRYIFWNRKIDIHSPTGQLIFKHELVHVQEKHTLDKLFMQIVLIFFWCNPFFWLIRKELTMIHEFTADQKSVAQQGAEAFAAMILQAVYPQHYSSITHSFFHSPIQRRLAMITKIQNPRISYFSRILALPLLALVGLAFTLKTKTISNKLNSSILEKEITVVIDAGHGGNTGPTAANVSEDELNLAIAKKIKEVNDNDKIHIILTRSSMEDIPLGDRVKTAEENKADLFISIHTNAAEKEDSSGMTVLIPKDNTSYTYQSKVLSSIIVQQLSTIYQVNPYLGQRTAGIWVLDHNVCPAVLLELGYITNKNDRTFISNDQNQRKIAERILVAITNYAANKDNNITAESNIRTTDKDTTIPKQYYKGKEISNLEVLPKTKQVQLTLIDGTKKTLSIEEATKQKLLVPPPPPPPPPSEPGKPENENGIKSNALIMIDDVEKGRMKEIGNLDKLVKPENIESVHVLKGTDATNKYGAKGKEGVIEITTKKEKTKGSNTFTRPIINGTQMDMKLEAKTVSLNEAKKQKGLLVVDGKVFKGSIDNLPFSSAEIKNIVFAKGQPLVDQFGEEAKNGIISITTTNYYDNVVTLRKPETQPVFTQTEEEPQFPGGVPGWRNFLQTHLNAAVPVNHGAPEGSYTVRLKMLVDADGKLSSLEVLTHYGYGMEEEVLRTMHESPNWIPATQNGKKVGAYKILPVTFVIAAQ